MLKEFGLKSIDKINLAKNTAARNCSSELFLSPSGNLLAFISSDCQPTLSNASSHQLLNNSISQPVQSLTFTADDLSVFYATPETIFKYDIRSMQETNMGSWEKNNTDIAQKSLTFSKDYRTLYYVNKTQIYSLSIIKEQPSPLLLTPKTEKCNIKDYVFYPSGGFIATSSPYCYLCKWDKTSQGYQLSKELDLSQYNPTINNCQEYSLEFSGQHLYLNKMYNANNLVDILEVNPDNFTLNKIYSRSLQLPRSSSLVFAQNYILTIPINNRVIWINQNQLQASTSEFSYRSMETLQSIIYNPYEQELYSLWKLPFPPFSSFIDVSQLSFNCMKVRGSTATSSSLEASCPCPGSQVFNKQTLACQQSPCSLTSKTTDCPCPANFIRNSFNWQCGLDCSSIENALLTQPFGSPPQCACSFPYSWQILTNSCVLDCNIIQFANGPSSFNSCLCNEGYSWNLASKKCIKGPNFVPPIEPLPPSPTVKTIQPYEVATIVFFVLSAILVIVYAYCYYRLLKKRANKQQQKPKSKLNNKQKQCETSRPIADIQLATMPSDQKLAENKIKTLTQTKSPRQGEVAKEDVQNFSITDDDDEIRDEEVEEAKEEFPQVLSQIQSNIENPLK